VAAAGTGVTGTTATGAGTATTVVTGAGGIAGEKRSDTTVQQAAASSFPYV
jgi:hypothetical protein